MAITNQTGETWYSVSEYANALGYNPNYLKRLILAGKLPAVKRKSRWYIHEEVLKQKLAADPIFCENDIDPSLKKSSSIVIDEPVSIDDL